MTAIISPCSCTKLTRPSMLTYIRRLFFPRYSSNKVNEFECVSTVRDAAQQKQRNELFYEQNICIGTRPVCPVMHVGNLVPRLPVEANLSLRCALVRYVHVHVAKERLGSLGLTSYGPWASTRETLRKINAQTCLRIRAI